MSERRGPRELPPEVTSENKPNPDTEGVSPEVEMEDRLERLTKKFGRVPTPIELEAGEKREWECTNDNFLETLKELVCGKLLELEKESGLDVYIAQGSSGLEKAVMSTFARILGRKKELKVYPGVRDYEHPIVLREVVQIKRDESTRIQHGPLKLDSDGDVRMKYVFEVEAYVEPRYQSYGSKGVRRLRFVVTFKDIILDPSISRHLAKFDFFSRRQREEYYNSFDRNFDIARSGDSVVDVKVHADSTTLNRARKENSAYLETQKEAGRVLIREGLRRMYSRAKHQK